MNLRPRSDSLENEKTFRLVSYVLVFLMLMCLIMEIGALIHNAIPAWPSSIMAGAMLLVAVDRLYTYPRFKALQPFSSEWAITFITQWIVLIIFMRLLLSYAKGTAAFIDDMRVFVHGDLDSFFSPDFFVTLLLAILAWYIPTRFLELLDEIGLDQSLALREDAARVQSSAAPPQQRLAGLVFSLGVAVVIVTSLARIDFRALAAHSTDTIAHNQLSVVEAGALFYFIFGLALLALGRLISLQTQWNVRRVPISSDNFVGQWGKYSLLFLFLIVAAVSLLPTGDSLGIFSTLQTLIGFVFYVLIWVLELLVGIVYVLISIPFLLLSKRPPQAFSLPPPPDMTLPPPSSPYSGLAFLIWLRSIILWGALILIIVFSFRQFMQQHENLLVTVRKAPVVKWLILFWEWLRRSVDRTREGLTRAITDGWQSLVTQLERRRVLPPMGLINLRSLDPRRRIYFFYLAMLRRSDEQGLTRKPSATPSEFAETLAKGLPSADEDIDSITGAFVEARYSRHAVDAGKANIVKAAWGRIRRALQEKAILRRSKSDDRRT